MHYAKNIKTDNKSLQVAIENIQVALNITLGVAENAQQGVEHS